MKGPRAFATLIAAAFLAAATTPLPASEPGFQPIEVKATPITAFRTGAPETRFGQLEFRGGLVLGSTAPAFGSLSGMDFSLDGSELVFVADTGSWLRAKPIEENGKLIGMESAVLAPILDRNGRPIIGKKPGDAEGLRIVARNGKEAALVSFEQTNDLRLFAEAPDLARATPKTVKLPATVRSITRNRGFESVAVAPADGPLAGATMLIAERSLDLDGNHRAFVLSGPRAGTLSIKRIGDYDVTDAAFLPDGDLLILERRFSFTSGFGMRLRRIAVADVRPGKTVDGPVLLEADMRYQIDNMEGLAVRQNEKGETVIAVVSDDNHNILQRTILLYFVLAQDPKASG